MSTPVTKLPLVSPPRVCVPQVILILVGNLLVLVSYPEAQLPAALPPLTEHSEEVRQVPTLFAPLLKLRHENSDLKAYAEVDMPKQCLMSLSQKKNPLHKRG